MASRPPTLGRGGPGLWSAPGGGAGPPVFQAPQPFASAPRGLRGQRPQTFRSSPRPGLPLYSEATGFHRSEGRREQAPPAPDPGRGAPAGPCPGLLPPPQLPLHLGAERAVQAPAAATGGRPQGRRVVLSLAPRDGTRPRERLPGPCGRLTVAPRDPEQRDTAQAAQPGNPSVTRTRAPPAPGLDAYTSGGWAVPAPPTSPSTGRVQGGPGAGPGLAKGAEDTSEEFRPWPVRLLAAPRPPHSWPALLEGPAAHLGLLTEASRMLSLKRPALPRTSCLWGHLRPVGGIHGRPAQTPPLQGARPP
ncbi:unnamed protein product [Rangifer tarandus platyrhynchus]|uniref:Uncharacterized protein n=2 Tax=Rangifer tarandus platyrhynchus TaxID=3082113 RepID=A0ACB0E5E8_RANTA|nr:unnamed protein product [Rangifer tarandus platyrhynchus]CAI9695511.1 unnamed protein product [Rangifer tarandus platyrhynchus]